jgi:hypothetical protein
MNAFLRSSDSWGERKLSKYDILLDQASLEGDIETVRSLMSNGQRRKYVEKKQVEMVWDETVVVDGLYVGHWQLNDVIAFNQACYYGHLPIVQMFANDTEFDLSVRANEGLFWACKSGHFDVFYYLMLQYNYAWYASELKDLWECACFGGNIKIVQCLMSRELNIQQFTTAPNIISSHFTSDWEGGLQGACRGGQQHIVDLMIHCGAKDFEAAFSCACRGGCLNIAKQMCLKAYHSEKPEECFDFEKGDRSTNFSILSRVATSGSIELVKWLCSNSHLRKDCQEVLFDAACQEGHLELVNYLITRYGYDKQKFEYALIFFCQFSRTLNDNHIELIRLYIQNKANNLHVIPQSKLALLFNFCILNETHTECSRHKTYITDMIKRKREKEREVLTCLYNQSKIHMCKDLCNLLCTYICYEE